MTTDEQKELHQEPSTKESVTNDTIQQSEETKDIDVETISNDNTNTVDTATHTNTQSNTTDTDNKAETDADSDDDNEQKQSKDNEQNQQQQPPNSIKAILSGSTWDALVAGYENGSYKKQSNDNQQDATSHTPNDTPDKGTQEAPQEVQKTQAESKQTNINKESPTQELENQQEVTSNKKESIHRLVKHAADHPEDMPSMVATLSDPQKHNMYKEFKSVTSELYEERKLSQSELKAVKDINKEVKSILSKREKIKSKGR